MESVMSDQRGPSFTRILATVWKTTMAILLVVVILGFIAYLIALAG